MKLYATSRISRRLGEKFFFKAERDATSKSAMVRRPYPPGVHGKRSRRSSSEFSVELAEKQKVRYSYGVTDKVLGKYVAEANRAGGKTKKQVIFEILESRLDNVVFRMGLTPSRRIARQVVSHGHILLNSRPVRTPSILVKPGDKVAIKESSRSGPLFESLAMRLKKYQPPEWLLVNPQEFSGEVKRRPTEGDSFMTQNLSKVIEFYSR